MAKGAENRVELRVNVILLLLTLWMGAGVIALWAVLLRQAPSPGIGNTQMALGWQGVAAMLGFGIWGISLGLPKDNGIRRMSLVPIGLTIAAVIALAVV